MVRRRSTVRFRNGAPAQHSFSKIIFRLFRSGSATRVPLTEHAHARTLDQVPLTWGFSHHAGSSERFSYSWERFPTQEQVRSPTGRRTMPSALAGGPVGGRADLGRHQPLLSSAAAAEIAVPRGHPRHAHVSCLFCPSQRCSGRRQWRTMGRGRHPSGRRPPRPCAASAAAVSDAIHMS